MREFLIYTSAGRSANVKQWYTSAVRNYDIWVTNYSGIPALNKQYSDYYNECQGSKFQNLLTVYQENPDILSRYKAIMVSDDDIVISPESLSALFNLLVSADLWIIQPAFSRFGKISHKITALNPFSILRYTNFIELGCPIFRTDKLLEFLSVYEPDVTTSFGIDFWYISYWGSCIQDRYAISDKYYCVNTRDSFKAGWKREINLVSSPQARKLMGQRVKQRLGGDGYEIKEFRAIRKSRLASVASIPLFTMEEFYGIVFPFLSGWRKILQKLLSAH